MRLRAIEPADLDILYREENDIEAMLEGDTFAPLSRYVIERYIENYDADPLRAGELRLVVCLDDDEDCSPGIPVGFLDFYEVSARDSNAQLAVIIFPEYRGRGLATQCVGLAKDYARSMIGLHSLAVRIHTDNIASRRLFGKCGFEPVGILRQWHFSDGALRDVEIRQCLL